MGNSTNDEPSTGPKMKTSENVSFDYNLKSFKILAAFQHNLTEH